MSVHNPVTTLQVDSTTGKPVEQKSTNGAGHVIPMTSGESVTGAISGTPKGIFNVPIGASIRTYPTAAGSAKLYSSGSPSAACSADIAVNNFVSGAAKWTESVLSTFSSDTGEQPISLNATCVAIVPSSGTWTLEVTR